MKIVTFYLLNQHNTTNEQLTNIEKLVYRIIITKWQEGKHISIACNNKNQAIKINKTLWTYNKNSFIPHNIINQEKISNSNKIQIYYSPHQIKNLHNNTILVNMVTSDIQFSYYFDNIIEFVPYDEKLKKYARKKYKKYLQEKNQLITVKIKK